METMAANYPGAFSGYKLRVIESHQSTKKDTSGTAKAVVKSFQGMGIKFSEDQIELVRRPEEQVRPGQGQQGGFCWLWRSGHERHSFKEYKGCRLLRGAGYGMGKYAASGSTGQDARMV